MYKIVCSFVRHISGSVLFIYTRRLRVQLSVNLPKELRFVAFLFLCLALCT